MTGPCADCERWDGTPRAPGSETSEPSTSEASLIATDVCFIQHKILKTDTLAGLAVRYNITVSDIKRANGLLTDSAMFARPYVHIPMSQLPVGEEVHVLFARLMSGYGRDASLNAPERRAPGTVAAAQLPGTPISAAASRRCSEADDDTRGPYSRRGTRGGHRAGPGDVELMLIERAAAAAQAVAAAAPPAEAAAGGGGSGERVRRRNSRASTDGAPPAPPPGALAAPAGAGAALRRASSGGRPPLPAKRPGGPAALSAAVAALSAAGSMGSFGEASDLLMAPEPAPAKRPPGAAAAGGAAAGAIAAWGSGIDLSAVAGSKGLLPLTGRRASGAAAAAAKSE